MLSTALSLAQICSPGLCLPMKPRIQNALVIQKQKLLLPKEGVSCKYLIPMFNYHNSYFVCLLEKQHSFLFPCTSFALHLFTFHKYRFNFQRVGNVLGAVDERRARRPLDAQMLRPLPADQKDPDGQERSINEPTAPCHVIFYW